MYVFDATPLIYLGKAERLGLLADLPDDCVIPEPVHAEVVTRGLEADYPDARRVEQAIDAGVFEVVSDLPSPTFERLCEIERLSRADAAVLAVADAEVRIAVMDDGYGRDIAATEGITTRGTAYLVLQLLRDGAITGDVARTTVDDMLEAGWYCSPDLYAAIVHRIDDLAREHSE